jgi:hypothetical protein
MFMVGLVSVGTAPPAIAANDGDLRMEGAVTYELLPDESRVRVTVEVELENRVPDRREGNTIYYTVYENMLVPVPAEATNVSAERAGGGSLSTFREELEDADPQWEMLGVNLSPDLRFGAPQTVRISFDLPDQTPRSEGLVRASPAYTLFPIYPMGDPEDASITVIVPDVYDELEIVGSSMRRSVADDGTITYTADDIDEEFYATLAARNDGLLDEREITSGDYTFILRYTPGDEEWADFAQDVVSRGVILLEQAIGEPWPGDADMAIVESSSPHAFGYAGWFDQQANAIEVSDQLDAFTMLHELAHAWFNGDTLSERWLREGLADMYADLAAHRMTGFVPQVDAGPSESDETVALAEWDESSIGLRSVDDYGYDTSWWAIDRIYDEIGPEAMTDVLTAAFGSDIAYASGSGEREQLRGPVDWRRFLDLLEEIGGSRTAREVYEELVLDDAGLDRLADRDTARTAYDDLVGDAGDWGAPYEVRRAMSTWTFPGVADLVAESEQILGYRDDVLEALAHLGVDELPEMDAEYQGSERLDDTIELSLEYSETAGTVLTAEERPDGALGVLTWVGEQLVPTELAVTDAAAHVADGDLDEARDLAEAINEYVDKAPLFGGIVLGQALLCLLLLPWIVRAQLRGRRRKQHTLAPAPELDDATSVAAG